jgi:hypothetical protein
LAGLFICFKFNYLIIKYLGCKVLSGLPVLWFLLSGLLLQQAREEKVIMGSGEAPAGC